MLVKDENFRKLYKSHVIIRDEEFSRQIAQGLEIDSIWEDSLSDDEFKEKMESIEVDERINAVLAIGYIDHTAGLSFFILTTASLNGNDVTIFRREKFDTLSNVRKGKVNDFEFEYLENLNVNDDFDLEYYAEFSKIVDNYFVNDKVEMLRLVEILDGARNEDYPDDLEVLFIRQGLQIEQMWVRCEDMTEDQRIIGTLLNTPYQEFGIAAGDKVEFFPYKPEDSNEWVLICDLNRN